MELEVFDAWYHFVDRPKQRLFLFWVKYFKPPLSKDLVRYIGETYFKVWVNPFRRLVELAVPHYVHDSQIRVEQHLHFGLRLEHEKFVAFVCSKDMLRLLMCENFLGVECGDLTRQIYPNIVLSNVNATLLYVQPCQDKHFPNHFVLDSEYIQSFIKK